MNTPKTANALTNQSLSAAIFLIVFGAFFRVFRVWLDVDILPNFAPLAAIALCSAVYLPRGTALLVPLVALLTSDILLNTFYHVSLFSSGMIAIYACYAVAWGIGLVLRRRNTHLLSLLGGAFISAIVFYLVTNTLAWAGNIAYAQTLSGWLQALTIGLPGYAPTWTFFRNSLTSDLLFTALFYGLVRHIGTQPQTAPAQMHA
ncbi:MAG: DUF6580 family putative transport protein [Chthoniobacterales bacterium]